MVSLAVSEEGVFECRHCVCKEWGQNGQSLPGGEGISKSPLGTEETPAILSDVPLLYGRPDTLRHCCKMLQVVFERRKRIKKTEQAMQCLLRSYPNPDASLSGTEIWSPR
jgi:hypothetical protein